MGCGSSSPDEGKPTPEQKRKQAQNGSVKNSPRTTPHSTPRKKGGQRSKKKYEDEEDEVVDSEAKEKGFKKLVRQKLIDATKGVDMEILTKAIDSFEKHKLEDCGDLRRANDRLQFLKLKRKLRDSIRRRHAGVLEKSIQEAKSSKFADRLQSQIEVSEKALRHLLELDRYSHDVSKMEQSTISELRSYQRPPPCVHDVMAATYMLMGYPEERLSDWSEIQAHLGQLTRDKLIRQVSEFDTKNVEEGTATRVKTILGAYSLEEVKDASYGAATFYIWSNNMVDKIEKDNQNERQEEENQTEQDEISETASPTANGGGKVKKKG